jgi:hypothetical protein
VEDPHLRALRENDMTPRIHAAVALLSLALLPAFASAQSKQGTVDAARAQAVAAAPKGASFRSAGQEYRVVPTIRAVKVTGGASSAASLATVGAGPADLLERKGPYALYVERGGDSPAAVSQTVAVAVNARSGQLGVITGTITARVASAAAAQAAAKGAGLAVEHVSPASGYAFFRAPQGADVLAASAALAARPEVRGVEVEVREAYDEPQ